MAASACVASAAVARAVPRPVKAAGSKHLRGRIQGASHATRLGGRGVVLAASAGDSAFVVDPEVVRQPRPEYIPSRIDDENYVRVFDTTLRDGEQSPGASESPPRRKSRHTRVRAWLAATRKKPKPNPVDGAQDTRLGRGGKSAPICGRRRRRRGIDALRPGAIDGLMRRRRRCLAAASRSAADGERQPAAPPGATPPRGRGNQRRRFYVGWMGLEIRQS